ncbi:extracellular solute-binding protein family 5 [gut metagenome]|uniref:Extracellular solute-binding protein family 5 n=1 Tax=gut metagenome TaxID=749906 RepID=J9GG78_9ZZZZ
MGLLFEKLIEIGPDMALSHRIASSVDCVGTDVTIYVRSGCTFADGTPITERDVAASIEAARVSEQYANRFANVTAVKAISGAVVLTLSTPDSLFAYLCDIPVLKASEVDSMTPVSSGRYTYGSSAQLVKNPHCAFPDNGPNQIQLVPVTSYEEMVSGLTVGFLNLYTARGVEDASPSVTSRQTYFRTNNLIFLGINAAAAPAGSLLARPDGRVLLSKALDRRQLAEKSYYSRAWPATGAINSFYPCVMTKQKILSEAELSSAQIKNQLEAMGYTMDAHSGYYTDASGKRLTLQLAVYSGSTYKKYAAALIQHQLASCGIESNL